MKLSFKPAGIVSDAFSYSTGSITLLLVCCLLVDSVSSYCQPSNQNHWFVAGSTGLAMRRPAIAGSADEAGESFRHLPGFAFDFSVGRNIGRNWEPSLRWGASTLFGESDLPHYSAVGYYVAYPGMLKQQPLEYVTQGNALSLILRYIFDKGQPAGSSSPGVRPFIEAGVGINNYVTEVRYSKIPAWETASLIFRNRNGGNSDGSLLMITGLGIKIGTPGEWNGFVLMNAEWTGYTSLSTVSQRTDPLRSSSRSMAARITAGLTIPLKRAVKPDNYLPFRW